MAIQNGCERAVSGIRSCKRGQQQPCAPKVWQRRRSGCLHRGAGDRDVADRRVDPHPRIWERSRRRSPKVYVTPRGAAGSAKTTTAFSDHHKRRCERRVLPDHHQDKPQQPAHARASAVVASSLSPIEAPLRAEHRSTRDATTGDVHSLQVGLLTYSIDYHLRPLPTAVIGREKSTHARRIGVILPRPQRPSQTHDPSLYLGDFFR